MVLDFFKNYSISLQVTSQREWTVIDNNGQIYIALQNCLSTIERGNQQPPKLPYTGVRRMTIEQ